jgi:UDP-N-acetylglucosamine pyrophosphorylase
MYDINLPSHKSLFQILTERFLKAQLMAHGCFALSLKDDPDKPVLDPSTVQCKMLVMTSPENHEDTVNFFHENDYFGGFKENFVFF